MAFDSGNLNATPSEALSGQYRLRPGAQSPILGQRPVLAAGRLGRLLRGQCGEQVSRTLSSVFTLCAHAHRHTARLALAAAQTEVDTLPAADAPVALYVETVRDHLRNIALDWPQRLPEPTVGVQSLAWLRDCPLPLATARPITDEEANWDALASLRDWLEQRVLQQDLTGWLASQRHPDDLARWCRAQAPTLLPAHCLATWHPLAHAQTPELRSLDALDTDASTQTAHLHQLALSLALDADFAQRPTWQGLCCETGPWTRLRHRHLAPPHSAWTRLGARWMELMELAGATPQARCNGAVPLLVSGAQRVGAGQALAWCEMARGLLLHWVQLDAQGAVLDYRVLAPTEWNFHPDGALARALAVLPRGDSVAARMLAAAFDPCVACTIETSMAGDLPFV